jgi:NAD(P)-dependent dehydrogenase (short-subunit alcohol dehydrogenase family)
MLTIGIIGAGGVGSSIARAAIASGYKVVIATSRGPETLGRLVNELGPLARAASAADAAAAGDFVIAAAPLKMLNDMPAAELAGKIVARLYDRLSFDTVDNSPLSLSWRPRPGQPAWKQERHTRAELAVNIARARRQE